MIVKQEKIFWKRNRLYRWRVKQISWWLFGIIPLYMDNIILEWRDYHA